MPRYPDEANSIEVIYLGDDSVFAEVWGGIAETLAASFRHCRLDDLSWSSRERRTILTIDESVASADIVAAIAGRMEESLVILAVDNAPPTDDTPCWDAFDDAVGKSEGVGFLRKRLQLYLSYLTRKIVAEQLAQDEPPKDANVLKQQVAVLQRQLNQVDGHLQVRDEVIEKIEEITRLSREINCLNLDKISSVCIESIPKLISARFASLYTYDSDAEVLHMLRHNHPYTIDRMVIASEHPRSPMVAATRNRELALIKNVEAWKPDMNGRVQRPFTKNYSTNSCIIAPLLSGNNVTGVLNLADKIGADSFDETRDLPPVRLLCEIIGSAMANIKLYEEVRRRARMDSATGLFNHRTFYSELNREVSRVRRYGGTLSLIMVDLDGLKTVNDTYGHRAGDSAINHVANRIRECIRNADVPARYGGDEFAVILPNTSIADAVTVARRLVELVAGQEVMYDGQGLEVSVSVGLSQYEADESLEEFMNHADAALFEAKSAGKNRMCVFDGEQAGV